MKCVFCDMIAEESPRPEDWKDHGDVVSFTPLNPVTEGHRLFVPKRHFPYPDHNPQVTGKVFEEATRWFFKQDYGSYNLIVNAGGWASQTVMHVHVHYVPRRYGDDLKLPWTGQHA